MTKVTNFFDFMIKTTTATYRDYSTSRRGNSTYCPYGGSFRFANSEVKISAFQGFQGVGGKISFVLSRFFAFSKRGGYDFSFDDDMNFMSGRMDDPNRLFHLA